jgi:flagellar hook-length control protein FliK
MIIDKESCMNISIPIIDVLNSNRGVMISNSECGINEMPPGDRSFMNYLLCHPEIERFSIPDSKSKNNDITQDCHNLEFNMLLSSMLNESCHTHQINTYNEALAKVSKNSSFGISTKEEMQSFQPFINLMDSSFHGNDDFSKRLNISLQALSADSPQTQVTEGERIDSKIMSDNMPEIKEMPKAMPELITKGLTKSPLPDTLIVEDLEIMASNISGAKEIVNESAPDMKEPNGIVRGQTVQPDDPQTELKSSAEGVANNNLAKGTQEISAKEMPKAMPELITKGLTKSPLPDTLIVEDLEIMASNISGAKEIVNRDIEVFSGENNKASDFINHGKDEDGFNYVSNKTDDNAFSHMFGGHSQNKNNPVTSEVVTAARRIIDIPENRFHIISKDATSVEVSVEPEEIGRLDIKLSLDKDAVKAKITAFEYAGKEVMERNIYNIVDSLVREGINISGFSVSLKDRRDNQNNSLNENKPEIAKQAVEIRSGDDLTENSTISIFI